MIKWMIEKLIQDNVVVLRTIRLPRNQLVHLRDEVDWCASAGSACEERIGIARQLWQINEMQVFFLLAFGARCSLTVNWFAIVTFGCVAGIVDVVFPRCIPSCGLLTFSQVL